ncbi:preprotein translocase subunit SecY [Cupriavidus taiwanensis]|uniref:Protein translocase subunit SecY n=1 Tax=Cupriavidus taiwanensis TaxID=164546 RepID=A0A375H077_9BURK|nr:preprotein translocase subunit SecY [Cupriavidus taiwanensis]MDK3022757.1 preprotein translocase subunit SecY [Cupriavidus taiwanensis]NSX16485.1 preprotein translocase subunit SecY [Cupriavidus taiwanensis]SOY51961.1 preprotein translocase, membrane component, transport across inner membrane (General Secretory Pathway) [Cupriavidus taiwanensis]SOY52120.1 preprotein translocase, membrane component, transport across inner membrane (General Secretory Pathway) [Cupriavidus taiwanensis]SOY52284
MATAKPNASAQARNTAKYGDLKRRLMFLVLALIVYRIGAHIPVPGIDPEQLAKLFQSQSGGILGMFNLFSGGALSRFTVFALGIMPYISASIIMQLLTIVLPQLESLKKEGQAGQRKITQYTRYGTVVLATFQALSIAVALESQPGLVLDPGLMFRATAVITLVTGTMFLMWLGEQITERGLGNGISIIIFGGIAAGLPNAIGGLFELVRTGSMSIIAAIFIVAIVIGVTFAVVFVERGQRKILVNYAKRQVGNKVYGGQSSHLPLKLNMAGVIPPIFASSIILFPATIAGWFTSDSTGMVGRFIKDLAATLSPGQPVYILLYAAAIVFFCFFYTALVYNSREVADNLKKSGAFIPGIRPGEQTTRYIDKILVRLTLAGAIYITLVCLLPEFLVLRWNVPFYFGGTSLLIIVVVTMDFMAQVQSYVMSQQYESLLKKANFKGNLTLR